MLPAPHHHAPIGLSFGVVCSMVLNGLSLGHDIKRSMHISYAGATRCALPDIPPVNKLMKEKKKGTLVAPRSVDGNYW